MKNYGMIVWCSIMMVYWGGYNGMCHAANYLVPQLQYVMAAILIAIMTYVVATQLAQAKAKALRTEPESE